MRALTCEHCGSTVVAEDTKCQRCGIPLPPNHGASLQKKFILFFVAVCLLCLFMIIWLPPNWSALGKLG